MVTYSNLAAQCIAFVAGYACVNIDGVRDLQFWSIWSLSARTKVASRNLLLRGCSVLLSIFRFWTLTSMTDVHL